MENHRKTIAGETLGVPGQKCLSAQWNVIFCALRERFLTEGDQDPKGTVGPTGTILEL